MDQVDISLYTITFNGRTRLYDDNKTLRPECYAFPPGHFTEDDLRRLYDISKIILPIRALFPEEVDFLKHKFEKQFLTTSLETGKCNFFVL
jgi:hypothetical protein